MVRETAEAIVTDKAIKADVSNKPGKADVVADTVNVIDKIVVANEVIQIKANETDDANKADEAGTNDADKAIVAYEAKANVANDATEADLAKKAGAANKFN